MFPFFLIVYSLSRILLGETSGETQFRIQTNIGRFSEIALNSKWDKTFRAHDSFSA